MVVDIAVGTVQMTRVSRRATYGNVGFLHAGGMFRSRYLFDRPKNATILSMQEHAMRKVLRGYAKDKDGNVTLIGTMPIPHSKDKASPRERKDKRHLVRQGATREIAG
jgi:hypothetical protein